jgi:hypothetical protein
MIPMMLIRGEPMVDFRDRSSAVSRYASWLRVKLAENEAERQRALLLQRHHLESSALTGGVFRPAHETNDQPLSRLPRPRLSEGATPDVPPAQAPPSVRALQRHR